MEVHLAPDLEKKLTDLAATTGRAADDFVQDIIAEYFDELARVQDTLDGRYDDRKSGRVQPIDGEEALARLREMSERRRSSPA
jgi:hypothetical protein